MIVNYDRRTFTVQAAELIKHFTAMFDKCKAKVRVTHSIIIGAAAARPQDPKMLHWIGSGLDYIIH
jgi:hypothetical protein